MKKFSLKFKKVAAVVLRVISIMIASVGSVILLGFIMFMLYLIFTNTHHGEFIISDNTRLFACQWMDLGAAIMCIGAIGWIRTENVLRRIKWRTEAQKNL